MRRTGISPEFKYENTYGTIGMHEEITPFGMLLVDIDDVISIGVIDIIWYESSDGDQYDLRSEELLPPIIYDTDIDKLNNHKIELEPGQTGYQLENSTKWKITIDINTLLNNYIYAKLKESRTFEGVRNNMTKTKKVNDSIREYIFNNLISRFEFSTIDFWIQYNDLRSQNILRYKNTFDSTLPNSENSEKLNKLQTVISGDNKTLQVLFSQSNKSSLYNFNYYFNLNFKKI